MGEFVVDRLYPHPLAVIDAAAFPIFRMHQVNAPVLESLSGSSSPVDVFEPLNPRTFNVIKAAKITNCTPERQRTMVLKIRAKSAIYFAPLHNRWNQHSQWPSLQRSNNRNRPQPESIRAIGGSFHAAFRVYIAQAWDAAQQP
jgi:hypothetical protein